MSDAKLRELERRWKKTGAGEDEAAYLLERVRVGELSQERLEAASLAGDTASASVTSGTAPGELPDLISRLDALPASLLREIALQLYQALLTDFRRVSGTTGSEIIAEAATASSQEDWTALMSLASEVDALTDTLRTRQGVEILIAVKSALQAAGCAEFSMPGMTHGALESGSRVLGHAHVLVLAREAAHAWLHRDG